MKRTQSPNSARQKMWLTIRIKRRFDIRDLLRCGTGAKRDNARKFLLLLEEAGFIAKLPGYKSGKPGCFQGYKLLKDAGPVCPVKGPSVTGTRFKVQGSRSEEQGSGFEEQDSRDNSTPCTPVRIANTGTRNKYMSPDSKGAL